MKDSSLPEPGINPDAVSTALLAYTDAPPPDCDDDGGGTVGTGGYVSSTIATINATVGTGILTIPYSLRIAGVGACAALAVVSLAAMWATAYVIARCGHAARAQNYQQAVRRLLGPTAERVVEVVIALYCFFCIVGTFIIVADVTHPVLSHFAGGGGAWWAARWPAVLAAGAVVLPLMCIRDITSLRFTAFASLAAVLYVLGVVAVKGAGDVTAAESEDAGGSGGMEWGAVWRFGALPALPNIYLALQCHIQVPSIYAELRPAQKEVRAMGWVLAASLGLATALNAAMGLFGYATFRGGTPANILEGGYDIAAPEVELARFCVAFTAVCQAPINHHPARSALFELLAPSLGFDVPRERGGDGDGGGCRGALAIPSSFFYPETAVFFAAALGCGLAIPDLSVLNSILGFTAGVAVIFIFPGLLLTRLPDLDARAAACPTRYVVAGWATVGFGAVVGVLTACAAF